MRVINLSSGSDGNLTYIEGEHSRILVDMGLSCKDATEKLKLIGVDGESIDAIVVTHEHSDHIKGINVFSKSSTRQFMHTKRSGNLVCATN